MLKICMTQHPYLCFTADSDGFSNKHIPDIDNFTTSINFVHTLCGILPAQPQADACLSMLS